MQKKLTSRKALIFLISVCMMFSSFAFVAAEEVGSDITGHWAEETLQRWIAQEYIGGYEDGRFQPNQSISRAEFVSLINRSFGLTGSGTISFTDLDASHWAYSDVAIAVQAGYISGYEDHSFRASQPITRQEVAVVVQRLLKRTDHIAPDAGYADQDQIAAWAREAVDVVSELKILGGYEDGSFQPTALMTRAEAVVTLDRASAYRPSEADDTKDSEEAIEEVEPIVYDAAGTYGPAEGIETVKGDVVIAAAGVMLRNMKIEGDLTFAEEIGDGDAFLKNVTVHGETFIYGGGEESLYFENTVLVTVTIDKQTGAVRIVATGSTTVSEVVVHSPVKIEADDTEEGSGINTVKLSEQLPEGSEVILTGTFENVEVASASIKITIPSGSIENFTTTEAASDMTLELGEEATIVALVLNAIASVLGEGTIQTATVSDEAQDSTFEKEPEEKRDTSGEVISTPSRSSGSGGGSRGGGGGGQTPKPEEPADEEEPVDEEDEEEPVEHAFHFSVNGGNGTVQALVGTGDSLPNERTAVTSGDKIAEGLVVFFLAEPDTGYRVKSWSVNGRLSENKLNTFSILVNQELNVIVEFEAIPVPSLTVTGPDKVAADADHFTVTFAVSHDNELANLEIDHNLGKHGSVPSEQELPEFKLYPNVDNPWAPADMEKNEADKRKDNARSFGLVANYDAESKTWTLRFGNPVLEQIKELAEEFANNQFKIYSIVKDVDGNQSGSMNDGSYETTIVEFEDPLQAALNELVKSTSMTVTEFENGFSASFDEDIVVPDIIDGYKIDVFVTLEKELSSGKVTILYNGNDTLAKEVEIEGTVIRLSDLVLDGNPADFKSGPAATWTILITDNDTEVKGTIQSIISSDGFKDEKIVLAEGSFKVEIGVTSLTMSADHVTAIVGEEFIMPVTVQGTVVDADKNNQVRFYGVIPGLTADDIVLGSIPGGVPEIVVEEEERAIAGANEDVLVLAWGPKGGFPLGDVDYSGEGATTNFKATINKAGSYNVTFVFYDITGGKQLNAVSETSTITVKEPDTTPPVINSASAIQDGQGNLILTVVAIDDNLYSLEVDHSHGKHGKWSQANLPEFTVYASEENPYGTENAEDLFTEYGVNVEYDPNTQTWTITFEADGDAMNVINDVSNGAIEFYLVVHDFSGNSSGSMYDGTYEKVVYDNI